MVETGKAIFYEDASIPGVAWFCLHMTFLATAVPLITVFTCLWIGFEYNAGRAWDCIRVAFGLQSNYNDLYYGSADDDFYAPEIEETLQERITNSTSRSGSDSESKSSNRGSLGRAKPVKDVPEDEHKKRKLFWNHGKAGQAKWTSTKKMKAKKNSRENFETHSKELESIKE